MTNDSVTRLSVRYPLRRVLLACARAEGSVLSLFVPSRTELSLGARVLLDIGLDDSALRFQLEGHVQCVRSSRTGTREPGLGVVFVGDQKRIAAQMLATCAGRSLEEGGFGSRHAVNVSCLVRLGTWRLKAAVRDVSHTGAFIRGSSRDLRQDAELNIQIAPLFGRWGGQVLKARVIWVGEKKGVEGFGVRFLDEASHVRASLKKFMPVTNAARSTS